jgi:hypothetical protein
MVPDAFCAHHLLHDENHAEYAKGVIQEDRSSTAGVSFRAKDRQPRWLFRSARQRKSYRNK